ncbi:hypothetical protein BC835DRAFT_1443093 [Cytidiella melzeri]|nr:hypothetical protein BC835DRAFT_1443093 [Cytidiella melzeri]
MSTGHAAGQSYSASYTPQQQPYVPSPPTPAQYSVPYSQPQPPYYGTSYQSNNVPLKSQSPPPEQSTAPEVSDMTPGVACRALRRLISFELQGAGFEAAHPLAMQRLETEVVTFLSQIFQHAHDCSNLANRAKPIVTDLMLGCEQVGYHTNDLHRVVVASRKRKRGKSHEIEIAAQLVPPPSRSPSPDLLSSDDEGVPPVIPATLRLHPHHLPPLPPKHTYLRTPVPPPKKAALPSLEKKLKTSSLVQESLKHLLESTEDTPEDNGDGEILGAVVNWEVTNYKRKRWKVGS